MVATTDYFSKLRLKYQEFDSLSGHTKISICKGSDKIYQRKVYPELKPAEHRMLLQNQTPLC